MATITSQTPCTVCASDNVTSVVDIHDIPILCNVPQTTRADALAVAKGDIALTYCRDCRHLYNRAFDAKLIEYAPGYENALDFSAQFRDYQTALAKRLIERHGLNGKRVIEIACGRGEFLKLLCSLGNNSGFGFDPSHVECPDQNAGVTFIRDHYSEQYADHRADLICCRHALEHIHFPSDLLGTIRRAIDGHPQTQVFFEVPNSRYTLEDLGIWDLIYEHCSYFSEVSLAKAFTLCGFSVIGLAEQFDGQFLTIDAQVDDTTADRSDSEALPGSADWDDLVSAFGHRYEEKCTFWSKRLQEFHDADKRVVVWGAGSKGVTFLNVLEATEKVEYVVDINPHKRGMYVAGTGQKIVAPEDLAGIGPDYVIVMNPIYRREIGQTLSELGLEAEVLVA